MIAGFSLSVYLRHHAASLLRGAVLLPGFAPGFLFAKMMAEKLKVTYRKVDDLIPYARNARTHSDEQVARIAGSIKEFGWTNPILTDGQNGIIAGHGRLAAARKLGLKEVPTIDLAGLSETQKRAYILADNKLALDAGWDLDTLKIELDDLKIEGVELGDLGFDAESIDDIFGKDDAAGGGTDDTYTAVADTVTYDPTGKKCDLSELLDSNKADELEKEIANAPISEEEKRFLRKAAARHLAFNYAKIADYYANNASPEMQHLMEKSALVIVDFESAIQNGFVKLSKRLNEIRERSAKNEA